MENRDFSKGTYEYVDLEERSLIDKVGQFFVHPGGHLNNSPLQWIDLDGKKEDITTSEIGYLLEFREPSVQRLILTHAQRNNTFVLWTGTVAILLFLLFFVPILYSTLLLSQIIKSAQSMIFVGDSSLWKFYLFFIVVCAVFLLTGIVPIFTIRFSLKAVRIIVNSYFADSLCVKNLLYILVDLTKDDILINPHKRKIFVMRINELAANTALLWLRFEPRKENNREITREHFRNMDAYIRERGRWAITPMATTLYDLQKDFYALASIYIRCAYGEFKWPETPLQPESVKKSRMQRFVALAPKIIGFVLPFIFLGLVIWKNEWLKSKGIGADIITLIFISWLLLVIDATLKLGVVAGIVNLAKEIKNLKQ